MGLVFFCMSCGARFEVDLRMAGKKGHCKKCGQLMEIPRPEHVASMAAMPALAEARAGAGSPPAPGAAAGRGDVARSFGGWLRTAVSDVGLAPLTVDRLSIGKRKKGPATPLDDDEDSKPYVLAKPARGEPRRRSSGRPNILVRIWRGQLGGVQKLFRKLNEFAYLISVPFLITLLLGTVVRNRQLALLSATVVVLLNAGRIISGVANLAVVPLRDGLNFQKMKKPFRRVAEPVLTIGLVVLAFSYVPWLATGAASHGSISDRLRSNAKAQRNEMRGEVEKTVGEMKGLDLEKLGAQARERLKTIGTGEGAGTVDSPSPGVPKKSAEEAVSGLLKDLGKRVRETVEESQKQP
jgi:hypothetical protein